MKFREFMEVKFDPSVTQIQKRSTGDRNYISRNFAIKIDANGNIAQLSDQDYSGPHYEINPNAKEIKCHRTNPFAPEFHKLINALASKYHDIYTWDVQVFGMAGNMVTGNNQYYRKVEFYLKAPPINVNNKLPHFFYHGTCTNLYLTAIQKDGLKPRLMSGSTGTYGAQNIGSISQGNLIYLAVHPDVATRSASEQAAQKHGGSPLILKIDTQGIDPTKLQPDEDARNAQSAQASIHALGVLAYAGRIPPSFIQPFLIGRKYTKNNRYMTDWTPYVDPGIQEHPWTAKLKQGQLPYRGDAEYYIFKDAGIIGQEETRSDAGFRNTNTVKLRDADNNEIVSLLKNGNWANNVKAIQSDLGSGYQGVLYGLKNNKIPDNLTPEEQQTLNMLLQSKLVTKDRNHGYLDVNTWETEQYAVSLAKLIGKGDFRAFLGTVAQIIKKSHEQNPMS